MSIHDKNLHRNRLRQRKTRAPDDGSHVDHARIQGRRNIKAEMIQRPEPSPTAREFSSGIAVAAYLNDHNIPSRQNAKWHTHSVARVVMRTSTLR